MLILIISFLHSLGKIMACCTYLSLHREVNELKAPLYSSVQAIYIVDYSGGGAAASEGLLLLLDNRN